MKLFTTPEKGVAAGKENFWALSPLWYFVSLENQVQNFSLLSPEDVDTIDLEAALPLCFAPILARTQSCSSLSWHRGVLHTFIFIRRHPRAWVVTGVMESIGIGWDTSFWRTVEWTTVVLALELKPTQSPRLGAGAGCNSVISLPPISIS